MQNRFYVTVLLILVQSLVSIIEKKCYYDFRNIISNFSLKTPVDKGGPTGAMLNIHKCQLHFMTHDSEIQVNSQTRAIHREDCNYMYPNNSSSASLP